MSGAAACDRSASDPAPLSWPVETPTDPEQGKRHQRAVEALGEEIAELSAHITAATYRLLVLIRRFDEAEGWHGAGFTSCARWLSWRTGVGPGAAREKVRVARALGDLPHLSRALERGEVSYSVARAVTRVATPENEARLVEAARHSTAAEVERLVRAWRATGRAAEAAAAGEGTRAQSRGLTLVADEADGSWVIRGRLDPEAGAALRTALEAAADELYAGEGEVTEEDADRPRSARRADALGRVAEAALGRGLGEPARTAERYRVVMHVPAAALAGEESDGSETGGVPAGTPGVDPPHLEGGPALSREAARRLACDVGLVGVLRGERGEVLDVGRKRRTVPTPLRRALEARDRGRCRFPGCGSRFTEAHHVVPWAEGGGTSLENLVLLCRRHHRRVHGGGWRVERREGAANGDGAGFRFLRPDGRELPAAPPRPQVPGEPALALVREQQGLEIDHWTPTPRGDGVGMDVDWALWVLRDQYGGRGRLNGGVPAETSGVETRDRGGVPPGASRVKNSPGDGGREPPDGSGTPPPDGAGPLRRGDPEPRPP